MKKFAVLIAIALLFPLTACAQAPGSKWQEGTHYVVLDEEPTETPVIREYFSFWCAHCYRFESIVEQIKARKNPNTSFEKVHVNFMGMTGPDVQDAATRAMFVAKQMKQEEAINAAIFKYIHVQRAPITNLNDLRNIFIAKGLDGEKFDGLASSFGIHRLMQTNQAKIDEYRSYLTGVPNFIINGRYQPTFTRDMTPDDMIELIIWLSQQ